jgi:hypothetical protein
VTVKFSQISTKKAEDVQKKSSLQGGTTVALKRRVQWMKLETLQLVGFCKAGKVKQVTKEGDAHTSPVGTLQIPIGMSVAVSRLSVTSVHVSVCLSVPV